MNLATAAMTTVFRTFLSESLRVLVKYRLAGLVTEIIGFAHVF